MAYSLEYKEIARQEIRKHCKKNKEMEKAIRRKLKQVLENPSYFKPLRKPMQNLRRVHIMKSFVLIYSVQEKQKTATVELFKHHDEVYRFY
ncbi:type II toxin-antitoxin system RelE/ParE family toxin [Candidatus Micrarchaeota archaeon]|nr:type II toxin-antitoxin system RelE/ParE family toxin [Candidatus Micrarchaeota archaeon]MBU2477157.1 type II toxin-antitoxin system RelE/ParE family toxin [Candidatus Micrarchaeota archaeon]